MSIKMMRQLTKEQGSGYGRQNLKSRPVLGHLNKYLYDLTMQRTLTARLSTLRSEITRTC